MLSVASNDADGVLYRVGQPQRYAFQIETSNAVISGLMIVVDDDENITGSMINEFGISALDFRYSKKNQKVRLLNVIKFLNRWYIKRTLKSDIQCFLQLLYDRPCRSAHKYEITHTDEGVSVFNSKRDIKYTFTRLIDGL